MKFSMNRFKLFPFLIFLLLTLIFFKSFVFEGKLPIPTDTIVGLYYPYRDYFAKEYPRGIPFKNFMVTDPVRQQYPWKYLTIDLEKRLELPLWNPYTFSGTPLMSNFQSGALYPLNVLFLLPAGRQDFSPFAFSWGFFILLQPLLAMIFLYSYLNNLGLNKKASILGSVSFAFGGFSVSWLEWGNVIHTALWLPLILLSLDKIMLGKRNIHFSFFKLKVNIWWFILLFSLLSSFFAGHLQTFFYILIFSFIYSILRLVGFKNKKIIIAKFLGLISAFTFFSFPLWFSGLQFILLSGRSLDQDYHTIAGWFLPFQNIVQLIIPDFFGNPATLNYWGVWNYGEFIGYIGLSSIIFAVFALFRKDKKTLFFFSAFLIALIFALPTIFAKIPYKFDFPFIATSQPTRLMFIIGFSLSVLAALGFDYFLKFESKKKIIYVLGLFLILFASVWFGVFYLFKNISVLDLAVTKQNLILPTILLLANIFLIGLVILIKNKKYKHIISAFIIVLLFADLLRFGWKYLPFSSENYLYPNTKTLNFLKDNLGNYRYMADDSRVFPPNFSIMYKLQSLDGYDPLYLERYAQLMAAFGRGQPDIHTPFGFNRIITPQNYHSNLIDLFGVKYVLTLDDINGKSFKKVLQEGDTRIYENKAVLPRAFFVKTLHFANNNQDAINKLFELKNDLKTNAIVEEKGLKDEWEYLNSEARITKYSENKVIIETNNSGEGFLVFTDSYYPTWRARVDGKDTKIYITDYNFRGVVVPQGKHKVEFYITLF